MIDPEVRELLARAHDDIITLRRANESLAPKAHAYDTIAQIARLTAAEESRGMQVDVAWQIRQLLDRPEGAADAE